MAQYRCSIKPILSRGKGASVARSAAYIAREKIEDERTGETFDFSRHNDKALWSGIYAPKNAPEWAHDLQSLVREIEGAEKRKDAQLALPIELSLAHELTLEQNRWMLQDFVRENFTRQGYAAIASIHEPPQHGDERNIHAHVLVSLRKIDEDGFSPTKKEQQEFFLSKTERTEALRQSWEKYLKHHLKRHGFENEAEAVSCKSLEAQGIDREPTKHLGPVAAHMERNGDQSERGDINRDIEARNRDRERLQLEAQAVGLELTDAERVREAPRPEQREEDRGQRFGKVDAELSELWSWAQNGEDFTRALRARGFVLAQGDSRDFVIIDRNGKSHSVTAKPEEVRAKLADIDREDLPTIPQAQEMQEERREHKDATSLERSFARGADMVTQQQAAIMQLEKHHKEEERRRKETINKWAGLGPVVNSGQLASQEQMNNLNSYREETHKRDTEREEQQRRQHREEQDRQQDHSASPARKDQAQLRREEKRDRTEQTAGKRLKLSEILNKKYTATRSSDREQENDYGRERER
ncbi:MAG: hypothetical protein EOM66_05980 [Clostridia bacterium]|nr:hypothetical protein [Clostridia bacterium]